MKTNRRRVVMSNAFDTEVTERMSRALSEAWTQFRDSGRMNGDGQAVVKAALARAIVGAAEQGVSDENGLVVYALAHYAAAREAVIDRDLSNDGEPPPVK
jgi:hypothetical protein